MLLRDLVYTIPNSQYMKTLDAPFKEQEHPREKGGENAGQFTSKGGGSSSSVSKEDFAKKLITNIKNSHYIGKNMAHGFCGNFLTSILKLYPEAKPYGVVAQVNGKKYLLHVTAKIDNKYIDGDGETNLENWKKEKEDGSGKKFNGKITKIEFVPVEKKKTTDPDFGKGDYWIVNGIPDNKIPAEYDSEIHGYIKKAISGK